jgi:hypothetical protein
LYSRHACRSDHILGPDYPITVLGKVEEVTV